MSAPDNYSVALIVESGLSATGYAPAREDVHDAQEIAVRAVLEELRGKAEIAANEGGGLECIDTFHLNAIAKRWGIK